MSCPFDQTLPVSTINTFLLKNRLFISHNPCVSPDFCLDWNALKLDLRGEQNVIYFPQSRFVVPGGIGRLVCNDNGDHAWIIKWENSSQSATFLKDGMELKVSVFAYPATFENLLILKNLIQEVNPASTIFPTAAGSLERTSLGVGARFTTLHWPAVEWAMAQLGLSLTANQNSIPRELVYDVDEMLAGTLDSVPFPFIGANVPEGHQGQSVQGMSHGAILSKLKNGFHTRGIPWGFNADHQPIGGKFDSREDKLVEGCALASYITFDLSPELAQTKPLATVDERREYVRKEVPAELLAQVRDGLGKIGLNVSDDKLNELLAYVWPAMKKMKQRDDKYRAIREKLFTTPVGRAYYRELSIDELPGLTTPETTAVMLLLCRAMGMPVQYVAPAFGFQKNFPYVDNVRLGEMIGAIWNVCKELGVSIGFHSGSGKSAQNYRVMGEVTGGRLEVKTSGRYTYEMGVALSQSKNEDDQRLWKDWYDFTRSLAIVGAFSADATEQKMARSFIVHALEYEKRTTDVFASPETCRQALASMPASSEHMYWFEYNFLYVLTADGRAEKSALGDHSPRGYNQRSRFYSISDEARLLYSRRVAEYLIFLAESTTLVTAEKAKQVREKLNSYPTLAALEKDISAIDPTA
jgi:hypothetical protein